MSAAVSARTLICGDDRPRPSRHAIAGIIPVSAGPDTAADHHRCLLCLVLRPQVFKQCDRFPVDPRHIGIGHAEAALSSRGLPARSGFRAAAGPRPFGKRDVAVEIALQQTHRHHRCPAGGTRQKAADRFLPGTPSRFPVRHRSARFCRSVAVDCVCILSSHNLC